jgi:hypothetical protein
MADAEARFVAMTLTRWRNRDETSATPDIVAITAMGWRSGPPAGTGSRHLSIGPS